MPSFADIANKKADQIEKPPLPPVGHYAMQVTNTPEPEKKTSDKGTFEIIDFQFQGHTAMDDVDLDELKKFGGAKGVRVRKSFIFNTSPDEEAAFAREEYNLKRFLVEHLKAGPDSYTLAQLMGAAKGKMCTVEVGLRPDNRNPDNFYSDVKSTAPIE